MEITQNEPTPPPPVTYTLVVNQAELDVIRFLAGSIDFRTAWTNLKDIHSDEDVMRAIHSIYRETAKYGAEFPFNGSLKLVR